MRQMMSHEVPATGPFRSDALETTGQMDPSAAREVARHHDDNDKNSGIPRIDPSRRGGVGMGSSGMRARWPRRGGRGSGTGHRNRRYGRCRESESGGGKQ